MKIRHTIVSIRIYECFDCAILQANKGSAYLDQKLRSSTFGEEGI